ncbi:MAG: BatA domain-containing protein [Acidobacteria bacterium]|nr:BatA domain-containing protein [Acidobacteriota bacterium]
MSPWFLAGAAAVGLPVWLHLLRKHRTTPLPFGSLMFFEKRTQSSIKHRRLRYLVLFALRSLLVLLIVLAFAHPYVRRQVSGGDRTGEVTVVAVDNSLSMRAGTRLSQARNEARSMVDSLRAGQKAEIVAFGSRVQVMSEVTDDRNSLKAAIESIEPGDTRTSYAEFARSLRAIAASLKVPLAVEMYTDEQQSGWPSNFNDLRLSADIRLHPHAIDAKDVPNFTVENVIAPRRVYDGRKNRVLATIAGFGTKKATRAVSLVLNGRVVESKQVEVPEGGRAAVEFLSLEVPYGRNKGEVRIDSADSLPADDAFYFSVERADPKKALFVQEAAGSRGLLYFKAALDSAGQSAFEIDPVPVDQVANANPARYAFVVLNDIPNVPSSFESALRDYVRGGGGVLIALGVRSAQNGKVPVTGETIAGGKYSARDTDLFQTVATLDSSHPAILRDNRWEDVKFYHTVKVNPSVSRVVARLTDQSPMLLDDQIGEGHVMVFGSTFDNLENDFPIHTSFVPFIDQTARYLGRLDAGPASTMVGSFAELRDSKEKGAAVDVVDPKGERALSLEEATRAQNIQFTMAGFYDIRRPNGRNELVAVNADRHESDLTPLDKDSLALWQNTATAATNASGGAENEANRPVSLWWYVMMIVLLLALAESLIGNRHLSVDKEAV